MTDARLASGFSQEAFGQKIGKSQSAYAAYETGESEPDHATWRRLADAAGLSPGWLAFGVGRREPDQSDVRFWDALESQKENKLLTLSISLVTKMLTEEEFPCNLAFIFQLGMKLARGAEGVEDQLEAREIIRRAVESERAELRDGLNRIREGRI